jgi:hypothetical protein
VAVQVDYESGDSDVFYTGLDESWQGERTFDEGWEQPWYKSDSWARVSIISQRTRSPAESLLKQEVVSVFESLPASAVPGACILSGNTDHNSSIELSVGAFAGIVAGAVLAALAMGVLGTLFLRRRRGREDSWTDSGGVATQAPALMSEPLNLPGEAQSPISITHRSATYADYRPTSAISSHPAQIASSSSAVPQTSYAYPNVELAPPRYTESPAAIGTMTFK